MRKLLLIVLLASCHVTKQVNEPEPIPTEAQITENLSKEVTEKTSRRSPRVYTGFPVHTTTTVSIPTTTVPHDTVYPKPIPEVQLLVDTTKCYYLLVRFDGYVPADLGFKLGAGITDPVVQQICIDRIILRYQRFNVWIGTNQAVYDRAPTNRKAIISFGNSLGRDPGYGGMTFKYRSNNTSGYSACYIDRLGNSGINDGELGTHESGHGLFNLYHHVTWSSTCTQTCSYCIKSSMSDCYGTHNGFILSTSPFGCNLTQDDSAIIIAACGLRPIKIL